MSEIKEILIKNSFRFNKQFGQNFITDINLLNAIVSDANIEENDVVVEIGAGAGTLTKALALRAKKVFAFEIDLNLKPVLEETLSGLDNVEMIYEDFQKISESKLEEICGRDFKVVANLPYYITTPLVMRFLESKLKPKSITVMVQKEVAERFIAKKSTENYGAITVAVDLAGNAKIMRIVTKNMFYPVPKVDSAVVNIELENKYNCEVEYVKKFVKSGFAMRRKTLVNNLCASFGCVKEIAEDVVKATCGNVQIRGEALDTQEFIKLSEIFKSLNK